MSACVDIGHMRERAPGAMQQSRAVPGPETGVATRRLRCVGHRAARFHARSF